MFSRIYVGSVKRRATKAKEDDVSRYGCVYNGDDTIFRALARRLGFQPRVLLSAKYSRHVHIMATFWHRSRRPAFTPPLSLRTKRERLDRMLATLHSRYGPTPSRTFIRRPCYLRKGFKRNSNSYTGILTNVLTIFPLFDF